MEAILQEQRNDYRAKIYESEREQNNLTLQIGFVLVVFVLMIVFVKMAARFRGFDVDAYDTKTDLSSAYVRPGLNIDNLPQVKIDFGKFRPSENTGNENNDGDDDSEESAAAVRARCLQRGLYLGPNNEYTNCAEKCHVSSEKEVQYTFVTNTKRLIAGRQEVKAGAWCLPTKAATCNLNSSTVVYSLNGWLCLPRTDALVGEGGNRIAVCNGSIWDNALRTRYDEYIPSNLVFNDFYEDKVSNDQYRFTCVPNTRDELRNRYLTPSFNRFHMLRNYCVSEIPFAVDDAVPDFSTGKCSCPSPYTVESRTGKCTACRVGFDPQSMTFNFRVQPCFSVRDYVSTIRQMKEHQALDGEVLRPCGLDESDSPNSEVTRPRCLVSRIGAFSPFLPSPDTLANLRDKISGG